VPAAGGRHVTAGVLRPRALTVGETLDGTFQVLRRSWPTGIVAILVLVGALALLSTAVLAPFLVQLVQLDPVAGEPAQFERLVESVFARIGIIGLLSGIVFVAAEVSTLWAIREAELGRPATVGGALLAGLKRAPGLLLVLAVIYLGVTLAFVVFGALLAGLSTLGNAGIAAAVVVGIAAFALLGPAGFAVVQVLPAASVIEERGAWSALGRAVNVVLRRFWRAVGVTWLLFLLGMVLLIGASVLTAPLGALPEGALLVVLLVQQVVVSLASIPLLAGIGAMLLLDGSARLDGADLSARTQGIEPRAGGTPGW
jgi:hypothetical protein